MPTAAAAAATCLGQNGFSGLCGESGAGWPQVWLRDSSRDSLAGDSGVDLVPGFEVMPPRFVHRLICGPAGFVAVGSCGINMLWAASSFWAAGWLVGDGDGDGDGGASRRLVKNIEEHKFTVRS
ncbi:hypothetical protein ACP70R_029610 [Stipagrostis hirtigluma subsp. patula]